MPYRSFDIAHSNSVIEHVITWDNMKNFARETRRVAAWHYVQTPYFWFPVDPHFYKLPFYHWLPRPLRAKLLMRLPLAHAGKISTLERSEEHTSEPQSLMRISYAVFCLKKKKSK